MATNPNKEVPGSTAKRFRSVDHRNRYRRKNYQQTQGLARSGQKWEQWEIDVIMQNRLTDRKIAYEIQRSVMAIQVKRTKIQES